MMFDIQLEQQLDECCLDAAFVNLKWNRNVTVVVEAFPEVNPMKLLLVACLLVGKLLIFVL
jgi:hypothetical protein